MYQKTEIEPSPQVVMTLVCDFPSLRLQFRFRSVDPLHPGSDVGWMRDYNIINELK